MPIKKCKYCSKEFNALQNKNVYCSKSCSSNARWENIKKVDYTKECLNCKCIFESKNNKLYCSHNCRHEYQLSKKHQFNCEFCGQVSYINKKIYEARGNVARFCSKNCQTKFLRGEASPAFIDGQYIHAQTGDVMVLIGSKNAEQGINNIYKALKRIVVEKHIKRNLMTSECIIHVDGNRLNNNLENLFVCSLGMTRSIMRYKTKPMPTRSNLDTYV